MRWGRLRALSGKEVCAILARHDFREVRQRGSHIIMQKWVDDSTITVLFPNHPELRIGTLHSYLTVQDSPRGVRNLTVSANAHRASFEVFHVGLAAVEVE